MSGPMKSACETTAAVEPKGATAQVNVQRPVITRVVAELLMSRADHPTDPKVHASAKVQLQTSGPTRARKDQSQIHLVLRRASVKP